MDSWGAVKKPADRDVRRRRLRLDGGEKLEQAKDGLTRMLDTMWREEENNQVGLVTFSDEVNAEIPPAPLADSSYDIATEVFDMTAGGATALYDAGRVRCSDDRLGTGRRPCQAFRRGTERRRGNCRRMPATTCSL